MAKDSLEERLDKETEKWEERLEERLETVAPEGEGDEDMIDNARAYLEDSSHFEQEGDLVRAFEAVVWGWAWLEIGEEIGVLNAGEGGEP